MTSQLEYYEDDYPKLPACLDRKREARTVCGGGMNGRKVTGAVSVYLSALRGVGREFCSDAIAFGKPERTAV